MSNYVPTIGLEIHAELKTETKMFCNSKNDTDEVRPNVNVCPICMGHPGTLPVVNKQAVKHVLKVGVALGGTIANYTGFDRKNYFYPDIPKGYQISQYAHPLVKGGELKGVALTRIHLEEDTATSEHEEGDHSLVNFNRAGVPLMELVTEPVIKSSKEAGDFARELQLVLRSLSVSEAHMEKGEMRIEANISVSATKDLGTKVEVKNLNSFRSVEKAIEYEVARHIKLLEKGEEVVQETRGWDEQKGITYSQRLKEDSHDYRYFPDPDIPKFLLNEMPELGKDVLVKELPELPRQKRERFKRLGIKPEDAEIFLENEKIGAFFEKVCFLLENQADLVKLASNYIVTDLMGLTKDENHLSEKGSSVTPEAFAELIRMTKSGKLSSRGAKDILKALVEEGGEPASIADRLGLLQQSDEAGLETLVQKVISNNQKVVEEYKKGKTASLQFLIGQGMKESKGSANPEVLRKLIVEKLS